MRKAWFTCLLWSDTSVIVVLSAAIRAIKLSGLSYAEDGGWTWRERIGSAGGLDDVKRIMSDFVYYARVHNNYAIPRQARLPEVDAALRGRFTPIYLTREPLRREQHPLQT